MIARVLRHFRRPAPTGPTCTVCGGCRSPDTRHCLNRRCPEPEHDRQIEDEGAKPAPWSLARGKACVFCATKFRRGDRVNVEEHAETKEQLLFHLHCALRARLAAARRMASQQQARADELQKVLAAAIASQVGRISVTPAHLTAAERAGFSFEHQEREDGGFTLTIDRPRIEVVRG